MKVYINGKWIYPTNMIKMFENCNSISIIFRKSIKRKIRSNNKIFYKKYKYVKVGE